LLLLSVVAVSWSQAQQPRERPRPAEPEAVTPRERDDERRGRPGDDARAPRDRGDREGTPEGMPQTRLAPPGEEGRPSLLPRRWMLGVHAYNTATGVVVTSVAPRSPAAEVGLEPNDAIVTVDGFQVGYVNRQLYALGDELQHRAGSNGRVQLLVQNWRNHQLVNLDVTLQRDVVFPRPVPRERE
jgi:hypothetical protein